MISGALRHKPDFAQFNTQFALDDPAELLPQLLEQLVALGQMAQQLSQALGGNGHRLEQAAQVIEESAKR